MSQFPTSLPTFTNLNPATTLAANNHASRHNTVHDEVGALAAKVGINASTVTTSHDYKLSTVTGTDKAANKTTTDAHAANTSNPHSVTKAQLGLGNVENYSLVQILQSVYPVGSIYFNAGVSTNPATLLGFGTWAAWGAGRVPVGIDATQAEFDTLEETGGAKTHTLTAAQMPSHAHRLSLEFGTTGSLTVAPPGQYNQVRANGTTYYGSSTSNNLMEMTGGGGAHNNLQPYITVFMWKRTA